jgi:phage shock protein C
MKKLVRTKECMVSGVCGGIAQYFGIDATLVRLVWVIGSLFLGLGVPGLIAYIVCALVIPKEDDIID